MRRKGQFQPGNPGKPKGTTNKLTKTVKETVLAAFNELQLDPKANIIEWGRQKPGDFYQIAAKLIPTEVSAKVDATVTGPDLSKFTYEQLKELLAESAHLDEVGGVQEETD